MELVDTRSLTSQSLHMTLSSVVTVDEVYVGYKPGTLAPTLKRNLPVVECLKFRPMRNADNGCCPQFRWSTVPSRLTGSSADVASSVGRFLPILR
jgi:hypothetical protein